MIYELVSERLAEKPRPEFMGRYEQAFVSYQRGDFSAALELLDKFSEDSPSRVLARRCREYLTHPPCNWNGIHVFEEK